MADDAPPRLLLVVSDREVAAVLVRILVGSGYEVSHAPDGHCGLHHGLGGRHDLLLVDRGLPGIEGLDLIRRLRRRGVVTPTLLLGADSVTDCIEGLDGGADDYLVKPFDPQELLARLRALLRRHDADGGLVRLGDGTVDPSARVVCLPDGSEIELSSRESALLVTLASRPHQVFGRDQLKAHVFDSAESLSIVDTYVYYLRRKLGTSVIRTVRGLGYRAGRL